MKISLSTFFWFGIFCLMPFVQSSSTIDPDLVPKLFGFCILTGVFSAILFFNKKSEQFSKSTLPFFIVILLYSLTILFSLYKSINQGDALYDAIRLVAPLSYFFVAVLFLKKDKKSIETILILSNVALCIFLIFGILQLSDLKKPLNLFHLPPALSSTLTNKNFFSETLLLLLPFIVAGCFYFKTWLRHVHVVFALIAISALIILNTRSTLLAVILSALCIIPFIFKANNGYRKWIKPVSAIILLILLGGLTFFFLRTGNYERIKNQLSLTVNWIEKDNRTIINEENTNSVFERLLLWKNTLLLAKENPVSGAGLANWKLLYPKYGIGGATFVNFGAMHYEHPHNEYLLMLSERGLFALLLWLIICGLILWYAWKTVASAIAARDKIIAICMAGSVISFLVISFFGYPLYRSYSAFLFMSGIAIIVYQYEAAAGRQTFPLSFTKAISFFAVGFSVFSVYVLAMRYDGEKRMRLALREQKMQHFERMEKIVAEGENYFFPVDLTATPLKWYRGFAFHYANQVDSALYYFTLAEVLNPYHIQVLSDIGACYENKGNHRLAEQYIQKALNITPLFPSAVENLAIVYFNRGDLEKAYAIIHRIKNTGFRRPILKAAISTFMEKNDNASMNRYLAEQLKDGYWLEAIDAKSDSTLDNLKVLLEKEYESAAAKKNL